MFNQFLLILSDLNDFFLGYVALVLITLLGGYLSFKTRFFQIRTLPLTFRTFWGFLGSSKKDSIGTHPLKAFFASVGGMIGIGNVVAVTTAIQVGGPGALVWVWVAALLGSLIKYSEIFLGHKYRVVNQHGGYDGGPTFFLKKAFGQRWIPALMCVLLCIYGTEVYQFSVMVDSFHTNFKLANEILIPILLGLIVYAGLGGVARVGKISSYLMPVFTLIYIGMASWVIFQNGDVLPMLLKEIFLSAFTGHAAIGGFAGSSVLMALQQGVARAAYSADIGIGYDSIIHSESRALEPYRQARLSILGVLIDNLVCTCSIMIVLSTGVWKSTEPIAGSHLVQSALSHYFPYMDIFMPIFLFMLGYTTIIAYFCVCIKCARQLHSKYGVLIYVALALPMFAVFSYYDQTQAMLVMSVAQSLLLLFNLTGIFKLRNEVLFKAEEDSRRSLQEQEIVQVSEFVT